MDGLMDKQTSYLNQIKEKHQETLKPNKKKRIF